jgi:hypothetical protein
MTINEVHHQLGQLCHYSDKDKQNVADNCSIAKVELIQMTLEAPKESGVSSAVMKDMVCCFLS